MFVMPLDSKYPTKIDKQNLRVSIVIPVYNEEDMLDACLRAIAAQTSLPYEVLVVDNNSSDATIAIARRYPFVRVLTETRQGVIHARNRGFDAARGDIIGRIDADSRIAPDWVAQVQNVFADGEIDCVSGMVRYHSVAFRGLADRIDLQLRRYMARQLQDEVVMQGANMALRRGMWSLIRSSVCEGGGLHEDFDIGIHALESGGRLAFDERLQAAVSFRQTSGGFRQFRRYVLLAPDTYRLHNMNSYKRMYPLIGLALMSYVMIDVACRGYDPMLKKFSWTQLWNSTGLATRVNPATFVD
jgi:glycosyltransferase involved in cell wall biosynthesis